MSKLRDFFNRHFQPLGPGSQSPPAFADARSSEAFFMLAQDADPEMERAHRLARETLTEFYAHCARPGPHFCNARVRLPDPIQTKSLGKPCYLFFWLSPVNYNSESNQLEGEVFQTPSQLDEVYPVGLTLAWKPDDTYDWCVNEDGHFYGGFTLRVMRSRLSRPDQKAFDSHVGVKTWAPSFAFL